MAKQHFLVSPFGELNLRVHSDHVQISASDQRAGDWGLGWWHGHAQGDEAVFARSFWRAELGADPKPSVGRTELDAFVRVWALDEGLSPELHTLPAGQRARIQAYVQGFNQGRRRRGSETPWSAEDCLLLARALGFLEWWETRAPILRFLLKAWREGLSWARILDLWPGLGTEPDRSEWEGVELPPPFSAEARGFIDRLRRFRTGPVHLVPGLHTTSGRPLLAAGWVSDVTEPGLPFVAVRVESPEGSVRGLSRPGHPGFLSGRSRWLVWHAAVAVDDTIDLRLVERGPVRSVSGLWAGAGRWSTLGALLDLEEAPNLDQARERTQGRGSASLDVSAADSTSVCQWALGARWVRRTARDAWLPTPWGDRLPVAERRFAGTETEGRVSKDGLEAKLGSTRAPTEALMAALRFLLPDTDEGARLRRWTGDPGPESRRFERVYGAVLEAFWASSPVIPAPNSPEAQTLQAQVDRLIQAPHSAWMPSSEKNQRLGEAVRRGFATTLLGPTDLLSRRAEKSIWTEMHGTPRTFAMTAAFVVDPGEPAWRVFLTDDETEPAQFRSW